MTKQYLDFLIGRKPDFPQCLSHSQTIINIFRKNPYFAFWDMGRHLRQQQRRIFVNAAGHLCIFLLEFHCELNFIEFLGCSKEVSL